LRDCDFTFAYAAAYFEKYKYDPYAFFVAKAALFYGNKDPFVRGTLFSPYRTYKTEADRNVCMAAIHGKADPRAGDRRQSSYPKAYEGWG
jgi:hypothetical protein